MQLGNSNGVRVILLAILLGASIGTKAQALSEAAPPASIPTFSTEDIARKGFFYVGGHYVGEPGKEVMHGSMYVEVWVPKRIRHTYPVVFLHDKSQSGTLWTQTPDGRPGWAYSFVKEGYVIYIVDNPTLGRSAYDPDLDGKLGMRSAPHIEKKWTDLTELGNWPGAKNYTQWPSNAPNKGKMGDPVFDDFVKAQMFYLHSEDISESLALDADLALLDKINVPVIMIGQSQGGSYAFQAADARPNLVKAILAIEPPGPPIQGVDTGPRQGYNDDKGLAWGVTDLPVHYSPPINDASELQLEREKQSDGPGLVPCWLQKEPAHKLVNLVSIPILDASGEAGEHRVYDSCDAKWLRQAGVSVTYVKLEDVGIRGNSHKMELEKNSDDIAKYFEKWIEKNVH